MGAERNPLAEMIELGQRARGYFSKDLFQGKVVLVTGGARGIGRAISVVFGALGAKVIVNYRSREDAAAETADAITALGSTAYLAGFDVANFDQTKEALANVISRSGTVDILVNNAGVGVVVPLQMANQEHWNLAIDVNLRGAIHCCKLVCDDLVAKRAGKVVNVASMCAVMGTAGQTAYSASKAGLLGLTRSLAQEMAPHNVQVNAVVPGIVMTDAMAALDPQIVGFLRSLVPAKRMATPEEVAWAAVFLASPLTDYITGEAITLSGGLGGMPLPPSFGGDAICSQ